MALPRSFDELLGLLRSMSPARLLALGVVGAGSLAFLVWLSLAGQAADHRLLFRGLAEDEAAKVVDALGAEKIPYRLEEGGTAVYVPSQQVPEARIRLAGRGLPSGGGIGFEIFDRAGFGVTDFVNRVNYRRALQGELARSIEQLEAVERARVQVALPERSAFVGRGDKKASASVILRVRPAQDLSEAQVRGIAHLVASSVEGLDAAAVSVVDHRGRLLSGPDLGDGGAPASAEGLRRESQLEQELVRRVESILEPTVGGGRVVARARVELDWTQTERTEERFDPDSQVARSEQRTAETSSDGSAGSGGVPGVAANTPDGTARDVTTDSGGTSSSSTQSSETINYEISKTTTRQTLPVGNVRKISLAVLVDGKPVAPAADGGDGAAAFTPWSAEELKQFEDLVKQTVGFQAERGDRISIVTAPFRSLDLEEDLGSPGAANWIDIGLTVGRWLSLVVLLLLFARLVVRPLTDALGDRGALALPARAGQLEAQLASGATLPGGTASPAGALGAGGATALASGSGPTLAAAAPTLADQVGDAARARSEDGAKALRNWLTHR